MPIRRSPDGRWRYRHVVHYPDGTRERISGSAPTHINTRDLDGSQKSDNETKYHCYRICRAAGLPEHGWHTLRHSYGTHAAMFGVNPWKLMQWMGHKRVDETMLYVHFAEAHMRPHPAPILEAQRGHDDPDQKIIAMLDARRLCETEKVESRGKGVAKPKALTDENLTILVR